MIPLIRPNISFDDVAESIRYVLESGQLTSGPNIREFEQRIADYVGVKYAFATTSATTALHLTLVAAGIKIGDEVLVSDFTFPASGNTIGHTGATPVLVDCKTDSYLLDLSDAEQKITALTKAIMPVATFGQPLDMDDVEAFAKRHNLFIVEDAACSLGAHWNGRRSGSMNGAGCFSFHPRKIITTGEGGMLTTNDDALAERVQLLRAHGGKYDGGDSVGQCFYEFGFNYRMSEIQAVLGINQIKRIDRIIEDRRRVAGLYSKALSGIDVIRCPYDQENAAGTFQSYVIQLDDGINRNALVHHMRDQGVETTLGTYAMHAQPAYEKFGYTPGCLPNSYRAQTHSLTLPLWPKMEKEKIRLIASIIVDFVSTKNFNKA